MRLRPEIAADDRTDFMENAPVGMHWLDADGTLLWANRADYAPLGYAQHEYVGRSLREFHVDPRIVDELLTRVRAGVPVERLPATLRQRDGTPREVEITASARLHDDGRLHYVRCFIQETLERASQRITDDRDVLLREEQRARGRLALLARASELLSQSFDYEKELADVTGLALPLLGDFGFLELEDNERILRFARAHGDDALAQ
ncbi:MAG: PAS domain-containing protein, partial [Polyangiales bacterium]